MNLFLKIIFRILIPIALLFPVLAKAQYFGQNKPRYERFDWQTYQTPNFLIYNYLEPNGTQAPERLEWIGSLSEEWYKLHQRVLQDTFSARNLMLLYNNHADFQQTNAIQGGIGTGTGGVTEAFKNRVIYPFALSNQQTDHVLGHELVHAFQYNIVLGGDSTSLSSLGNLPLWMVEGLAEYLSIGRVDAHTSMWMRDAVLNEDVPSIKKMNNPKYFPYRWGQAWWAFVTGLQGDQIIRPLFEITAKRGLDAAIAEVMGMSVETLSDLWVEGIKKHYQPFLDEVPSNEPPGRLLIDDQSGGNMNIAPQVSPSGRYVIFLSEKNLFSIDLFLADARTGKIIRQVTSKTRAGHIDDFAFVESAGTWDPKSERFAYVGVSKGRNVLLINEVERGKTVAEYRIPGVEAFDNPTWSPDGKSIVVSGLVQGQVDLYQFFLEDQRVVQLTDNFESELLPSWNAQGTQLVFTQDKLERGVPRRGSSVGFNLAVLDLERQTTETVPVFPGADNFNPAFDLNGDLVFLSNQDGFRNMYRYERSTGNVFRLTNLKTGVSGITAYAPALSVSARRDRIAYTVLNDGKYHIFSAKNDQFLQEILGDQEINLAAATLPTLNKRAPLLVDQALRSRSFFKYSASGEGASSSVVVPGEYAPEGKVGGVSFVRDTSTGYVPLKNPFKLDFISGTAGGGVAVGNPGIGSQFGVAGGINALFSDVLGNQQVFAGASLNGQLVDFAGQVAYINREKPLGWGASFSHIPFRAGAFSSVGRIDTIPGTSFEAIRYDLLERRVFEDRLGVFVDYPFSRTMRVEGGASYAFYSSRQDITELYYDGFGRLLFQDRNRDEGATNLPNFSMGSVSSALVGDNSVFGPTSPLQGYRYRVGVEQMFGDFTFTQTTVDGRLYQRVKPFTFAFRAVHYGRHGLEGRNPLLFPFYVGSQWFVRGLNNQAALAELGAANNFNFNALTGNNIGVANAEIRLPFTGPKRLALINFPYLYTELNLFIDAGLAYNDIGDVRRYFDEKDAVNGEGPLPPGADFASLNRPIVTAGASLRANVLGAIILEPFYARVINMDGADWRFGLNIVPGW